MRIMIAKSAVRNPYDKAVLMFSKGSITIEAIVDNTIATNDK